MSGCRTLRLPLAAYIDDEVGVDAALQIDRHLAECAGCRREVGRQRHLSQALAKLYPVVDVPAGLDARVRGAIIGRERASRVTMAAAVAGAVLAIGGTSAWFGRVTAPVPGDDALAALPTHANGDAAAPAVAVATAAAIHRRADDGELGLDLVSHDVATVNDWLRRALPFTGSITPPGSDAITLQGAALVSLGGHPAGLVRYRMHGRDVSLFLLGEPAWDDDAPPVRVDNVDFRVFQRRGLDLIGWSHAALSYLLVSEDGLTTGDACVACHTGNARESIADFVAAVAGRTAGT